MRLSPQTINFIESLSPTYRPLTLSTDQIDEFDEPDEQNIFSTQHGNTEKIFRDDNEKLRTGATPVDPTINAAYNEIETKLSENTRNKVNPVSTMQANKITCNK